MATNRKSTYELDADVKLSLGTWRVQLRHRGFKATEKAIIELLVRATTVEEIARLLERERAAEVQATKEADATRSASSAARTPRRR